MTFYECGIIPQILRAIDEKGYTEPTPIQEQAIPLLLTGKDVLGSAQTGTGKTAAFAIPVLQQIYAQKYNEKKHKTHALILTPTRELANQIGMSFRIYGKYTGIRHTVIFGGVSQRKQEQAIRRGADVIIATPGRLLDLLRQRVIKLDDVKYLVLDEADRMLDMGFIVDINKIIGFMPQQKHTMMFSATMPKAIEKLSREILTDPKRIAIAPVTETIDQISQHVYFVSRKKKTALLKHLMKEMQMDSALVFTRTKHGADRVEKELIDAGIKAQTIHGNKSQHARERALQNFKKHRIQVLVATDVASRGIDIKQLSFVVNYDLPEEPETYIHRIGRTGRAGLSGVAISFCDVLERKRLVSVERHIKQSIEVVGFHPYVQEVKEHHHEPKKKKSRSNRSNSKKKFYYQAKKSNNAMKRTA